MNNKIRFLFIHSLMNSMYNRDPDLHPQDACKIVGKLIHSDPIIKEFNKKLSKRSKSLIFWKVFSLLCICYIINTLI